MGAMVDETQTGRVLGYIEKGVAEGAKLVLGGKRADTVPGGSYIEPTVFDDVAHEHTISREEIFGPVLSVLTFRTPAEAIEKANNTEYGLSAGVWTEKGSRILSMVSKLRAGVVWANTFNRFDPTSPFGGYKESGYGREGGRHGLEAYLDV
jgi:acyl-CoA reductase-like NAD-dependent aldehyde dehydrogenase